MSQKRPLTDILRDHYNGDNEQIANTDGAYEPEGAAEFFSEILKGVQHADNPQKVNWHYNQIFQRCLNQQTALARLNLCGTFAKTDYLLKEHKASRHLRMLVNDLRVHLRRRNELSESDMQHHLHTDLKALCLFVALLFDQEVPQALQALWPAEEHHEPRASVLTDSMRFVVEEWDDTFLYGQTEFFALDEEYTKVCYAKGNKAYDFDWTYLKQMFYRGAQLNLVRPRLSDGVIFPELIIFEPDYLVDISTVARCFTSYAESAFVNLLCKIRPNATTEAILLGNFAGQMLDESIEGQVPYAESATTFFQNQAMSLVSTGLNQAFHAEAKQQRANIHKAMHETLPNAVSDFDLKDGMVEPSFFSEMLGLQGRMDYLQMDMKVLLEQKSGKGEFPFNNFVTPTGKEEHYVQILLYMLLLRYNFSEQYERNGRQLHAFLLYSKYKESLLGLGFAPELVFRALKVRNGIAWTDLLYTTDDGIRLLETLTPEKLNQKKTNSNLWTRYQQPQIEELLQPIHEASDTEREYYLRMLTFISNEHVLSKLGNKTKENSGFASKWHDSLEEKLQAGNIYDRLTLAYPTQDTTERIQHVELNFSETANNDLSNFRVGDIVILYPYKEGTEPDVRKTMVFRSTIASIKNTSITLRLRAAQTDAKIFLRNAESPWAIEHDFMESSYSSLYRGIHAFLSAPQERKDLLMLKREPEVDDSRRLKGDYGSFNELSLRVKQAKDLFLIIGPPGTGKTSYGMLNTLKEELQESDSHVLVMSYTNRAVDEICSKLQAEKIDFIRLGGDFSCSPEYHDKLISEKIRQCSNLNDLKTIIFGARVIVGTTTAISSNISLLGLMTFSLAIIDEASQILEPHLIGLLSARNDDRCSIRKMVFIGDHKQLPAVVQQKQEVSKVDNPLLNDILLTDCRFSLFERLLRKYGGDPRFTYMLTKQGRMHEEIAAFPNEAFYGGMLQAVPLPHQVEQLPQDIMCDDDYEQLLRTKRIAFIPADAPQQSTSEKVNQTEADIIAQLVLRIYSIERESFDPLDTVGIIVPYRNQIATIRNTIDRAGIPILHDITIDTVERYQGSQRRYIIYGFTIQRYYQLKFLTDTVFVDTDGTVVDRKLNVAMTRAKEHLIMVGNPELLSQNTIFKRLLDYLNKK